MDDKIKAIFQRLDAGTQLIKGEWTSDGRKLFKFLVTEILSKNTCTIDDAEERFKSGIQYCLTGKGNPPAFIWIYRVNEAQAPKLLRKASGIGSFMLAVTDDNDDDEIQEGYIEIYLDPISFNDFVQTINSLQFKGTIKFEVIAEKPTNEDSEDNLIVTEYSMENCLLGKLSEAESDNQLPLIDEVKNLITQSNIYLSQLSRSKNLAWGWIVAGIIIGYIITRLG